MASRDYPCRLRFAAGSARCRLAQEDLDPAVLRPAGVVGIAGHRLAVAAPGRLDTGAGHTDNTGSAAINNPLSVERAQSVRDYLVTRGVAAARVETAGRGEREPVASNATEAGRAKNRRVEIFLREPAPT